jgi:HAD superfamily hydrolase (TIGR01509 family)
MAREEWSDIRGVFFDLYGTLMVYGDMDAADRAWCENQHATLEDYGLALSVEEFRERAQGMFDASAPPVEEAGLTLAEQRMLAFYEELGLSVPVDTMRELDEAAQREWQRYIPLDPAAKDVLAALGRTKSVALISNYDHPPHVRQLLSDLDLGPFFECVVISGEVGVQKPDPRIFTPALEATGLQAEETVYVGDTIVDVDGARAAGIAPIRIDRERGPWTHGRDADLVVGALTELLSLFG